VIALDVDPNLVVSGWTPLFLTIGLGGVVALLAISMTRQMRKVRPDLPRREPGQPDPSELPADPGSAASSSTEPAARDAETGESVGATASSGPTPEQAPDSGR